MHSKTSHMSFHIIAAFVALVVLFGLSVFQTSTAYAAKPKFAAGDTAPVMIGVNTAGDIIETTQYAGKVLVVTFWASWCGPCLKELPILEGIQKVGKGNIQVVAINIEDNDQFRKIKKALSTLTLQLAHDYRKKASDAYGVGGIPHLAIIGRDGKIINVHTGYGEGSIDSIVKEINAALAVPSATPNDQAAAAAPATSSALPSATATNVTEAK